MTYKELLYRIALMTIEQQNSNVTVHNETIDEYFAVNVLQINTYDDVLDCSHPFLTFTTEWKDNVLQNTIRW